MPMTLQAFAAASGESPIPATILLPATILRRILNPIDLLLSLAIGPK
jgi:hypothetical protein